MAEEDRELVDKEFNLLSKNILLPYVRRQAMNDCYAYTVGEAIAALFADTYGEEPVELSTQQMVDYLPIVYDYKKRGKKKDRHGCYYSNHRDPLRYAQTVGLCKDEDYVKRTTRRKKDIQPVPNISRFGIRGFVCLYEKGMHPQFVKRYEQEVTEEEINRILKDQPIVGAIRPYESFLRFKGEDIYTGTDADDEVGEDRNSISHSILIIGHGVKNGVKYFKIKNTYGIEWGDNGLAKVRRDLVYALAYPYGPDKFEPEKVATLIATPTSRIKNINRPKSKRQGGRPRTSQSKASHQTQSSGALGKRAQMVRNLQREGPSFLNSLSGGDALLQVDLPISDKKWVDECLSRTLPYKLYQPAVKASLNSNSSTSNGLSSMFMYMRDTSNLQTSQRLDGEKRHQNPPQAGVSRPVIQGSCFGKPRNEVFIDCQKLVDDIVKQYPQGYNTECFKSLFLERSCTEATYSGVKRKDLIEDDKDDREARKVLKTVVDIPVEK